MQAARVGGQSVGQSGGGGRIGWSAVGIRGTVSGMILMGLHSERAVCKCFKFEKFKISFHAE